MTKVKIIKYRYVKGVWITLIDETKKEFVFAVTEDELLPIKKAIEEYLKKGSVK